MCEYCGCQQIAVIDELTREHDAVVAAIAEIRRQLLAGDLAAVADTCRSISAILRPHTTVEEEGLFPCLAGEFPDHVEALRGEHRQVEAVLAECALDVPSDPTWPARLTGAMHLLRDHILKEQDGVFPAALSVLGTEEWERIEGVRAGAGSGLQQTLHHHGMA